jgi:hypothetical protein
MDIHHLAWVVTLAAHTFASLGPVMRWIVGDQADTIFGGDDNDTLEGEADADTLSGDAGDDILRGGLGFDILMGGPDNDDLAGDEGADILDGGDDSDTANYALRCVWKKVIVRFQASSAASASYRGVVSL